MVNWFLESPADSDQGFLSRDKVIFCVKTVNIEIICNLNTLFLYIYIIPMYICS